MTGRSLPPVARPVVALLALCIERTLAMNLTIWAEAATGLALAMCCLGLMAQRLGRSPSPAS